MSVHGILRSLNFEKSKNLKMIYSYIDKKYLLVDETNPQQWQWTYINTLGDNRVVVFVKRHRVISVIVETKQSTLLLKYNNDIKTESDLISLLPIQIKRDLRLKMLFK